MEHVLAWLHPAVWLAWIFYWKVAAFNAKPTARRDTSPYRWAYTLPVALAFWAFLLPLRFPALRVPLFPDHATCYVIGTVLLFAGMFISVWARVVLGRNWSAMVTVKVDHELIQTGPYRWMRHPIYTGLLLALAGSALAENFQIDLMVAPLAFFAFWIKLRIEEAWMREEFGAKYDAYATHTARLIPYIF